ncbi:GLOBIN domain-containing protein [Aphelenchoides fujianensis]|nr:GLOBIN domain-containing protein [Aphelenchoides fujianensis]
MSEFENLDVKEELFKSLKAAETSIEQGKQQNGVDFYKYFFANFPALRVHFRGAEHYTPDDVQKSERFAKQGQKLLLALHILAASYDHPEVIRAYARDQVIRHKPFKMTEGLWHAFWDVWNGFLATRTDVSEATKHAWKKVGYIFSDEADRYQRELGWL